jgi:hypothetical protein
MPISSEALLALALIAVYLFDSTHFLCVGEAVITTRAGAPRRLSFGSALELGGRRPLIPNPLTPFWPEFRVSWDLGGGRVTAAAEVAAGVRRQLRALRPIAWLAGVCASQILILAPLALVLGQQRLFVAAVLAALLIAAAACAFVLARRAELGLRGWPTATMIVVALVCLPCAVNLARAVAVQRRPAMAASDLLALGFQPAQLPAIRRQLRAVLERARRLLPEDSPEHRVVSEQLQSVSGAGHEPD